MNDVIQLQQLRNLFSDRRRWTQGAMARTGEGEICMATDPDAECWCVQGGMRWLFPDSVDRIEKRLNDAAMALGYGSATYLNNAGTYEMVIAMINLALIQAKQAAELS